MKNSKNNLLSICAFVFSFCVSFFFQTETFCQNLLTSDMTWQASQANDLRTQKTVDYQCVFKTNGSQNIQWIQKSGQSNTTFTILNVQGAWEDINEPGSITYGVSRNADRGIIIIEKNENGTFITLDFSETSPHAIKQRFRIQSVQITN